MKEKFKTPQRPKVYYDRLHSAPKQNKQEPRYTSGIQGVRPTTFVLNALILIHSTQCIHYQKILHVQVTSNNNGQRVLRPRFTQRCLPLCNSNLCRQWGGCHLLATIRNARIIVTWKIECQVK